MESFTILVIGRMWLRAFIKANTLDNRTKTSKGMCGMTVKGVRNVHVTRLRDEGMLVLIITYAEHPGGSAGKRKYTSHGDWFIEGNFLITFTEDGRKTAHALPENTRYITEEKSDAQR